MPKKGTSDLDANQATYRQVILNDLDSFVLHIQVKAFKRVKVLNLPLIYMFIVCLKKRLILYIRTIDELEVLLHVKLLVN